MIQPRESPPFVRPRSRRWRRFAARYVRYLERFAYALVALIALMIIIGFVWRVDDVITAEDVKIEPREESLTRPVPVLVTRFLVENYQEVRQGQPVVEVVEDAAVQRRIGIQANLEALQKEVSGTPGAAQDLRQALERYLAAARQEKAGRMVLAAPIAGIVVLPEGATTGAIVSAGDPLVTLLDLNDLRLNAELEGDTITDARVGQEASVRAVTPDFGTSLILRADTTTGQRISAYGLPDARIKEIIQEAYRNRAITRHNDIPFTVSEVSEAELEVDLQTKRAASAAGERILTDAPTEMIIPGRVREGKHLIEAQLTDVRPDLLRRVQTILTDQLRGKTLEAPVITRGEKRAKGTEAVTVEGVGRTHLIVKLKGENDVTEGATERLLKDAQRRAVRGASVERKYEAVIQLVDPPAFLKERILQLRKMNHKDRVVEARVEVKTGRRPLALLLFKR